MSQQPFNSDGGFSTTGNVVADNLLILGNIGPSAISSPAPSINGFDSINSVTLSASGNVTAANFFGNGSQLTGVTATANTGNVTFNDTTISTDPATAGIDVYLRGGTATGCGAVGGNSIILSGLGPYGSGSGNVVIKTGNGHTTTWAFDSTGNLTLPSNSSSINYANGQPFSGGPVNTGNVTFNDITIQGTGDEYGYSGLYLAPGTNSTANLQYLRVRGGDYPTHIHLDTGNNSYFDQYFGADSRFVKLEANGNIVINADDYVGNGASWTFGTTGNLTLPANTFAVNYANGTPVPLGTGAGVSIVPNDVTYTTGSLYGNANPGFTVVAGQNDDDDAYSIPVDYIEFLGNSYSSGNVWLVSNSYLTFGPNGADYTDYHPVGPVVIPAPAIYVGSMDLSNQKYYYGYADGTDVFVIGYEGSIDTSGTSNYPAIKWELQVSSATPDQINIVVDGPADNSGALNFPAGVWGISDGAEWIDQFQPLPWYSNNNNDTYNAITIAPVTPVSTSTIAFTGPGVTYSENSGTTFINIDPFDEVISVGYDDGEGGGDSILSSVYYDLTLTTAKEGSDLNLRPLGSVNIDAGSASDNQPGNGYQVYINGGDAHDNPNSPGGNYDGGNVEISSGDAVGNGTPGAVRITSNGNNWTFAPTGNLALPRGGIVYETNIPGGALTGNTIALAPSGGTNTDQQLLVYPTANTIDANHLHLTSGNLYNTELFLGSDDLYVKLANTGNIVVNSNNATGNSAQWTFDAFGNITLPANGAIQTAPYSNGNIFIHPNGNGRVVIQGSTTTLLTLASDTPNTQNRLEIDTYGNALGNLGGGVFAGTYTRTGTPTQQDDRLASFIGKGTEDGDGVQLFSAAKITLDASANWTAGNTPSHISFYTTPSGANAAIEQMRLGSDGNVSIQGNIVTAGAGGDIALTGGNITGANVVSANIISATGNIQITSSGNTWNFDSTGNLTFPTGNLVITPDYAAFSNAAVVSSVNNLVTLSTGTTGGLSSLWVEDYANIGTSNIAAVYANPVPGSGNVRIAVGTNGGNAGPNLWDFGYTGSLTLPGGSKLRPLGSNLDIFAGTGSYVNLITSDESSSVGVDGGGGYIITTGGTWNFDTAGNLTAPGNISAVGNVTGAYLFGNGSQLTGMSAASVPSQTILPTIQTIAISATSNSGGGGQGSATVFVANTIPVKEYGVIITSGTVSQKYATGALGNVPGSVLIPFTTGLNLTPYTVYAYVTSNAGTYYSNAATGTSGICLLAGTQIALSDGTRKAIEDITYTDKMMSWDFDRGCYAETTAVWIKRSETGSQYNLLTFSDGTTLRTFDQHRIFNKQAGAFTYPMTDATPIGTVTVNEHGQEITLTNKQVIVDTIEYYNVITDYHMNLFSDTVLTSCRFNNIYPITDMKFVKDGRTLRTRAEFENIPDRFFYGLRLAEQTTDIETVEWYVNRLLSTEVSTESELTV